MIRVFVLTVALAGCNGRAAPTEVHVVEPLRAQPAAQTGQAATPSTTTAIKEEPSAGSQKAAPAGTRDETIGLLIADDDVLSLRPEAALARFASVYPLTRENETIDGFVLAGRRHGQKLNLDYVPDGSGGFACISATLELSASTPEESTKVRTEVEQQLRDPATRRCEPRTQNRAPEPSPADRGSPRP